MVKKVKTLCDLCSGACSIDAYIKDNKIVKSFGPCPRAFVVKDIIYSKKRIKNPMKRTFNKSRATWEKISWDDAFDTITSKLKDIKEKDGSESVVFLFGHRRKGFVKGYWYRLANLYGTPNMSGSTHVCTLPRRIGFVYTFGTHGIEPYYFDVLLGAPDYNKTDCLILWAINPIHQGPNGWLFKAKERGVKIINIDPRFTFLSSISDEFVQIRPGTDGALALGILNVIIEEALFDKEFCKKWTYGFDKLKELVKDYPPEKVERITWVPKAQIERVASMYAKGRSSILTGVGIEHTTNAVQTCRAINILIAVTGNYDSPGGNLEPMKYVTSIPHWLTLDDHNLDKKRLNAKTYPLIGSVGASHTKTLTPQIFDAILTGEPYPIKAMIVVDSNPALAFANSQYVRKALNALELLVVIDPFMTETAQMADVVLPASTTFEWTWYINTGFLPKIRHKVIDPLWESKPEPEIAFELGRWMGYKKEFPWKNTDEALKWELNNFGFPTLKELEEKTTDELLQHYPQPEFKYKKYEERGFATPSGKVEIYSTVFEKYGYDPLPVYRETEMSPISKPDLMEKYPLILITGKHTPLYTHSMFREITRLSKYMPENFLEMNPETARKQEICDGEKVYVESPTGRIEIKVKLTEGIHPRVVGMRHGFADSNCNFLIDNVNRDPISGSTAMKASLCRVVRKMED